MKNKTNNSINTSTTVSTYKTIKGVQYLPTGNYRVRKTIKGQKVDGTFKKLKDAKKFLGLILSESTSK